MTGTDVEDVQNTVKNSKMKTSVLFCGSTHWDLMERRQLPVRAKKLGMTEDGRNVLGPEVIPSLENKNVTKVVSGPLACHLFALTGSGAVYGWGRNESGQLGVADLSRKNVPVLVDSCQDYNVVDIALGRNHTLFLTADGKVLSCGSNKCGQLGCGSLQPQLRAKAVVIDLRAKAIAISAGAEFSIIVDDEGHVHAFGLPQYGQLGSGDNGEFIDGPRVSYHYVTKPERVESLVASKVKVKDVACGANSTIALDSEGKLWSWGFGGYGRLGHGDPKDQFVPKQIEGVSKVVKIFAGATFHYCVTQFKLTYFWGITKVSGESTIRPTPVADLSGFDVRSLACGKSSTIVAGETTTAAWGPSPCHGELGYGDKEKRLGSIVKSSTKVKVIDALEGGHTECVAMGSCFSAILMRRASPEDEKVINALPVLEEKEAPASASFSVEDVAGEDFEVEEEPNKKRKKAARGGARSKKKR